MNGHHFEPHVNPGTFPIFPQNATQPIIAQVTSTRKEKLRVWRYQQAIIKCCKNLLPNAFEDNCYEETNGSCVGFNNH